MLALEQLVLAKAGFRLDIGCGEHKQGPTWVGMDIQEIPGVTDVVWDWNCHPWPFPDESVLQAVASHVVEHIPTVAITERGTRLPFIEFMDEVWRILKPEGQFAIAYPHGSSQGFLQDPTHCHALNETQWSYFDPLDEHSQGLLYTFYRPKPWKIDFISTNPAGNVEVLLRKRLWDRSYARQPSG